MGYKGANSKILTRGGLILLVDDEESILKTTSIILGKIGYRVLSSSTGPDALSKFRESHADISLVMLDLIMPDMSGREIFKKMKKINPDVNVLLTSGLSQDDIITDLLKEGALGVLKKPFTISMLTGMLENL